MTEATSSEQSIGLIPLTVRVGVLEAQVSTLTTDLRSHQTYVAREFAKMDTKMDGQIRTTADNHTENQKLLKQNHDLLEQSLLATGAQNERKRWFRPIGNLLIALLTGEVGLELVHICWPFIAKHFLSWG